ncbi:LuxR family transcriptional regulator [Devosia riboflavina]|uniref:LuxR family transcriptional regulator n=1 Tax=Devosia riboflavina TaxID=46914 RepID=UPI001269CF15|nr:LuxR family transcriptional regulator [Devosia riboflavina]
MGELVDVAIEFIERCQHYETLTGLVADFAGALKRYGFDYFMMTRLPALGEDAEPYVIAHSWPSNWLDRYREGAYFWHDPVSLFSLSQARPFSWKEARDAAPRTRVAGRIASEAKSLGLADGIGFPMGDPSSVQAVVSLGADRPVDLAPLSRAMLHQVCIHAEMRAVEIYDQKARPFGRLTEREREVLRWIANGKNACDVGDILNLSERTVKEHLAHTRLKLNATTTTHAVARALKSRQIIL